MSALVNRRGFLGRAGASAAGWPLGGKMSECDTDGDGHGHEYGPAGTEREYWVSVASRLAEPVLTNLARGTLKARMPVEEVAGAGRASVTYLEAFGRLLAGIAPWLELPADDDRAKDGCARATPTSRGRPWPRPSIPPRRTP